MRSKRGGSFILGSAMAAFFAVTVTYGEDAGSGDRGPERWADVASRTAARTVRLQDPGTGCWITVRWMSWSSQVDPEESKVRSRVGWWVSLNTDQSRSMLPVFPIEIVPYGRPQNDKLFYLKTELRRDCDRWRRYRFKVVGRKELEFRARGEITRQTNPHAGIERWLYFPSENGWTRKSNLDLGWVDACLLDAKTCSKPYYPAGNATPPIR